ncbi:hypothetical protein GRO01_22010 [Gluconobacter roseus NBRC 3990]|uniref:Uncharacterized protein n=1 Tax=Gluconobacter roseus NBRC 3990 TaxID=1307950 RepID=A0A4Y3M7V2_9PROT|nr:hypothetical protein AA3990_1717 [Gluconobacter roseus NBRC 3990]GEB04625.1 hypothetical protein GRO01_22010 [Gluconobacter roseus NBRC 3990]GLP92240.1 hypothetical protein GCM10007871_02180 [Gluconobacter roseus NBRC 3990]
MKTIPDQNDTSQYLRERGLPRSEFALIQPLNIGKSVTMQNYRLHDAGFGPICPPHAATHVPLAHSRLRNDVKRSGLQESTRYGFPLFAGPFDRFATHSQGDIVP